MRFRLLAIAALLTVTVPVDAGEPRGVEAFLDVGGDVLSGGLPVGDALVIAFGLSSQSDERASTDAYGRFALSPLPIGVYRVIAVKHGFAPAVAMVVPGKKEQRLTLRLKREETLKASEREDVWEIRRALPRDILREVEAILDAESPRPDAQQQPSFAGDVMSVQGFDSFATDRTADRTSLALRGGMGDWGIDLRGKRQSVASENQAVGGTAEAADVAFELRAPRGGSYRIASSSASWQQPVLGGPETALENHSIAWFGRQTRVALRYSQRENIFEGGLGSSDGLELEGERSIYHSDRARVGMHVRFADESAGRGDSSAASAIYAEFLTAGSFAPVRSLEMEYGLLTRAGRYGGVEYVPQAATSIGSMKFARVTLSGACKFASEDGNVSVAPLVTQMGRFPVSDARYRYAIALSRELGKSGSVTASGMISEADNAAYVFFDDRFEEFWDGLEVSRGDEVRSVALAASVALASMTYGFDASAGEIDSPQEGAGAGSEYVVAAIRASHDGAGTTIDIAYRLIGQPRPEEERIFREVERASIVLAQSLHLPLDLRLMIGVARSRERDSSVTADAERDATRLVGGLAFSF